MKPSLVLASIVALVAISGCNSKPGNSKTSAPIKLEQVQPPKGGDWTMVVNAMPDGGFMMGNPNAKVKLLEIGSLTCPHCKAFDDEGVPTLVSKYVKSGQVSWEFRNYVRDPFDLAAVLVVRCNGPKTYFPLMRGIYNDQAIWVGKIQATSQEQLQKLSNLPPSQQFVQMASVAGLQDWAAARGVPQAKSNQCLANQSSVNQLVQMTSDATVQFPDFQGTPTFAINGSQVKDAATWDKLEPELKKALGG